MVFSGIFPILRLLITFEVAEPCLKLHLKSI